LIIKEAYRTIARTFGIWTMSVLTFAIALGVAGLFLLLAWQAHSSMQRLRASLSIEAFFDPAIASGNAAGIAERAVKPLDGVGAITFISKEQALSDYATSSGEDVSSVLGMNPLPASVSIRLRDPSVASAKAVMEELRAITGIANVQSDLGLLSAMTERARSLDIIAILLGSLLVLSAIFFTLTSGKLTIASRSSTVHIMKLMGATRTTIVGPFVIESAAAGALGGLLAAGLILFVQHEALHSLGSDIIMTTTRMRMLTVVAIVTGTLLAGLASLATAANSLRFSKN
jgi:cell division transport system permease protein